MRKGDRIVSIMGEQLTEASKEYAKSIIARLKLRLDTKYLINFIIRSHLTNEIGCQASYIHNNSISLTLCRYL